ncbi:MAG: dual specificity protein phosphatase family protein [Pyrinomonadaceae bacterium]|jgi:protein-tyrosine phosphatase|nr:dual specificity protein phosphatase family protein [Pyrinomonadaceae bacterium]
MRTEARTSLSHPIRVDFVASDKLTFAPGKRHHGMTGNWQRDLSLDLARLRDEYNASLLVSLIEEHEFESLQIKELRERAADYGIKVLWSPIRDISVPKSIEEFAPTVQTIVDALRAGQTVVVHCMGGLGRTGLAAACALVAATELTPEEAILIVRRARPGAIQTFGQEEFVTLFHNFFINMRDEARFLQSHIKGIENDES